MTSPTQNQLSLQVPSRGLTSALKEKLTQIGTETVAETIDAKKQALEKYLEVVLAELATHTGEFSTVSPENFRGEEVQQLLNWGKELSSTVHPNIMAEAVDPCDGALIRGLVGITAGAILAGPVGAIGGFITGVADLATSC
jgi:hypothetical protein